MGTTGISLALVCAAKGYGLHIVFSDAFSDEKRRTMQAYGATVEDVPSVNGGITEGLVKAMQARAHELSAKPMHWWCDQLTNKDAINGYLPMGEEIWTQTGGRVDAFVHAVSTAHSIQGVARALRAHQPTALGARGSQRDPHGFHRGRQGDVAPAGSGRRLVRRGVVGSECRGRH